ncbi:MAG: glycosyltransferase family 2 protein [Actinomycetota bacterium]|nr:glycosyltransferase family 2 protein [Actinomycetota bacterium]
MLTPSFDQAAWLPHNLRSVACQTYPSIEHIVMDGGSTDGSLAVLDAEAASRAVDGSDAHVALRYTSEPDRGQSHAVNKAFAASHGEIIGWINSDDAYFDCRVIEDVVRTFQQHPEADVVYGHLAQVAEDGTIIWLNWVPRFSGRLLNIVNFIGQPVAFIRRSALSQPMLDESYDFTMDYELWLRLAREGRRFRRIGRITAVDRHQRQRKGVTMTDVLHADLGRLAQTHGRGYPPGKRILSWGFYTWRRAAGALLIPKVPRELAFTDVRTSKWALLRRQLFSWNKRWPDDYEAGSPA